VPVSELKRLGRRGSYRLGKLRVQGTGPAGPPPPRQPRFARPRHQRVLQALAELGRGRVPAPPAPVPDAEIPPAEALDGEAGGILVGGTAASDWPRAAWATSRLGHEPPAARR
jgi:hypothetical protein